MEFLKPLCFIDLETTGTDKSKDRIVEISIMKMLDANNSLTRTARINPGIPIPEAASDVHGITNEMVKDCPLFRQVAKSIYEYISDCDIAGYNSNSFDVPFLYNEFYRCGIAWDYSQINFVDVCNIFRRKEERTLSAAVNFYCDKDHTDAHGAEADVMATAEVFFKQLEYYDDLPKDISSLAKYSNYDKEIIDLGGCFSKDDEGDYIFNFGKHKGKKCKQELSYLQWMQQQDFLPDAIIIIKSILSPVKTT
jgi:DNA polymerase-3 subunit epsilon